MELVDRALRWGRDRGGRLGQAADLSGRVAERLRDDRGTLVAAGLAFYGTLSIVPAAIAAMTVYALTTNAATLTQQLQRLLEGAPRQLETLVIDQAVMIYSRADASLGGWAVAGLLLWAWSASRGTSALLRALNLAYGVETTRGAPRRRLVAVGSTVAVVFVAVLALGTVQAVIAAADLSGWQAAVLRWGRWPVFGLVALTALAVAYRYGADRSEVRLRWVSVGSAVAAAIWSAATVALIAYVGAFGLTSAIYGVFGAMLAAQLWLFVATWGILAGAYVNAELARPSSGPGAG